MFPNPGSSLSFTKIISGISKSLNIANQLIPLYKQVTPMVSNARKAFSVLKEINLPINKQIKPINQKSTTIKSSTNNPTFFK